MASIRGFIEIPEGRLFWRVDLAKNLLAAHNLPALLFIHAGVADHTLWDTQTNFFIAEGFDVIRYDIFGFGRSLPKEEWLGSKPNLTHLPHEKHASLVITEAMSSIRQARLGRDGVTEGGGVDSRIVVVGLSFGAIIALDAAITHPQSIRGLVAIAGGISGIDHSPEDYSDEERALFSQYESLVEAKDIDALAELDALVWGVGPRRKPDEFDSLIFQKLVEWCKAIESREVDKTGGGAFEYGGIDPPACKRLDELRIPVAVGLGLYDVSVMQRSMRHLASNVKGTELKEFNTAHMVNLEAPDEVNAWLKEWLQRHFTNYDGPDPSP